LAFVAVVALQQLKVHNSANATSPSKSALKAPDPDSVQTKAARAVARLAPIVRASAPSAKSLLPMFVGRPTNCLDKFRGAILQAELGNDQAARDLLKATETAISTETHGFSDAEKARLAQEVRAVNKILDGQLDELSAADRDALVSDHGFFGQLILTRGKADTDPEREPLIRGGNVIVAAFAIYGTVISLALLGGIVAAIILIVRTANGKTVRRFQPPAPGGSVYVETAAAFCVGFLVLQLALSLIPHAATLGTSTRVLCQLPLALTVFWPLLRGVSFATLCRQIGWHRGKRLGAEIGLGVVSLLAAIPFVACAFVMMSWLILRKTEAGGAQPTSPVFDLVSRSSSLDLVMLFVLATLWAPFVEESIFRGALFRHLRGRCGVVVSTFVSTLAFGFMHGYDIAMILPVLTLGLAFALTREWRGSIVASMVAHFIFNATQLSLGLLLAHALQ